MPTEILHSFICLACSVGRDDPDLLELRASQAMVIVCAAVSRKWQDVTASHPELWSRLFDCARYPLPTLCRLLRLSRPRLLNVGHRSAPLTLSWPEESLRNVYPIIRLIYLSRKRIRELHVEVGFGGSNFLLNGLCNMEALHLEVLTWHAKPHDVHEPSQPFPLPNLPFKRLDFRHVPIVLRPTPCLRALTALSIYHSPIMTLIEWLHILRSAHQLRFLSIHSSIQPDGQIYAIRSDCVPLVDLALLTLGSLTSDEANLHLLLLTAIGIPPTCGLHIAALPYVHSAPCRAMLRRKISKMMGQSTKPALALDLVADRKARLTMGTVKNPHHTLDWAGLGEQGVLAHLRSSRGPVLAITTYSASVAEALEIYPQVISYFGRVTYDRVTSFRMTVSPFEDCQFETWPEHPCFEGSFYSLSDLFSRLHRVTSLSVNDGGALVVLGSHVADQDAVEPVQDTSRRERPGQAGPISTPDFPLLCNFTLHASESYSYMGTAFAREIITARLLSKYPLCTANLPPIPDLTDLDECAAEHILSYERMPVGFCRILRTSGPPLVTSAYFEQFCERT